MALASLLLIAFAMSGDAFAVAVSRGVAIARPTLAQAMKNGLLFGLTESLTPLLGWALGYVAVQYVSQWDHWIVFALLSVLGLRMLKSGLSLKRGKESAPAASGSSFWLTLLLAVSTSLDSFALGISLAFAEVNIFLAAALIGSATFIMVTLGTMLGHKLGELVGRRAEVAGGLILIIIGSWTLYNHIAVS